MRKFIVKFGYFQNEYDENLDETEAEDEKESTEVSDDITESHKTGFRRAKEEKEKILYVLKKDPAVIEISPLENKIEIKNLFSSAYFGEPIRFKIRVPLKCQEISQERFHLKKIYETVEDFNVILQGTFFAVYQEVNPMKLDFLGGPEIREKMYTILKQIYPNLKRVAPTPFRENFIYLISYTDNEEKEEIGKHKKDFVFPIDTVNFDEEIYYVFRYLGLYLRLIYNTYYLSEKISDIADEIINTQKELNLFYNDFINSSFLGVFDFKNKKSMKQITQDLCNLLLDYVLAINTLEGQLNQTIFLINNTPLQRYIEHLKHEANQYVKINTDVMFKYVESMINEIDVRSINFSTIISGIIGGVIGSLGTIIITFYKPPS